jgi:plasmid stabilization system protein ParE
LNRVAKVIWQPQAISDIRHIARYINDHDPRAARDISARLFDLGESLATFPRRGRPKGGEREMTSVPPYILRYVVRNDAVFILSIRHGARNAD